MASCRAAYEGVIDDPALLEMVEDPSRIEDIRSRLADAEADDRIIYLVYETDDEIVGFVQMRVGEQAPDHVDDETAYLRSLYVHPEFWNCGIGTELLRAAMSRLPEGTKSIKLSVLSNNEIGKEFYKKHAFEKVGTGTFEIQDVCYDTNIYSKSPPIS